VNFSRFLKGKKVVKGRCTVFAHASNHLIFIKFMWNIVSNSDVIFLMYASSVMRTNLAWKLIRKK
jgi:hypothetical protein